MSDLPVPVDQIKVERRDVDDIEELLPSYKVFSTSKLLEGSIEVVDCTEDEYMQEFKSFLNTLDERRHDIEARRRNTKAKSKSMKRIICVPAFLLAHVRMHQDSFICELFRLNFTNVMLYGTITSETFRNNNKIYQLDDGTAKVNIHHRASNTKMLDNLNKLTCCEETLRRKPSPLNEESVPESAELRGHLMLLISIAKEQCNMHLGPVKLRSQCFVIGSPFRDIEGKVAVFAHTILPDSENGDSCELFWKSNLLSLYEPMLEHVNENMPNSTG